jgi:hypothetical protein
MNKMNKFVNKGGDLFINNRKVLKAWESFNGWYWFATEKSQVKESIINGTAIKNDQIWFGLVQSLREDLGAFSLEEEWEDFSEGELDSMKPEVWQIGKENWGWSGRR